jgi:DNA-binding IclR family transcriptional regulator
MNSKISSPQKGKKTGSLYKPLVPAVEQSSKILLFLGESPRFKMRLTDICRQVGIPKSKGYSILNTLKQYGFVEKDLQTKSYSLGPSLIFLSRNVLDNMHYPEMAGPFLDILARETNGTAVFGLISGSHLFVVAKREGNQNLGFGLQLGHRFHITLGSHGKAIVAFMSEPEREKMLSKKNLYFYGEASRMDMKRLRRDMSECRETGFALDRGGVTPGVNVISAPVFGPHEKLLGCVILIGTFSERRIGEDGPKVVKIARQISHRFGADVEQIYPAPRRVKEWRGVSG